MVEATQYSKNDKAGKHPTYYENVKVVDINGYEFTIGGSTVPGPIKVETSSMSHPAYNPDKEVKQVSKGRLDKFAEKMKRMEAAQKK
jgi:ribosomal protein L31